MKYSLMVIMASFILACSTNAQDCEKTESARIVFYNVENLFDAIDDPSTDDSQYLPTFEKRPWTDKEYHEKLGNISKVIIEMLDGNAPLVIGISEVENYEVMKQLVMKLPQAEKLGIIHEESADERGIDIAMLYNKELFKKTGEEFISIQYPFEPEDKTRDIVYATGTLCNGEELHVFVNHWKSRYGGTVETEPKRMYIAEQLRKEIDVILAEDANANIVVMGDLNDEYFDKSVVDVLGASHEPGSNAELFNITAPQAKAGNGTIAYKCKWQVFDQMIVSRALRDEASTQMIGDQAEIFKKEYMLYQSNSCNDMLPSRYSSSSKVFHGYSDHLPVYFDIRW